MRILDKYILSRFVFVLLFAVVGFVLVVIFVDMVGNIGKFLDKEVPPLVIAKYYAMYIPFVVILVLPIAMMLASMFSIGHLAKNNELVSIKSTGISLNRILLPVFFLSILISVFALYFGEKVTPKANQKKAEIEDQYLDTFRKVGKISYSNLFLRDQLGRYVFIGRYDTRTKTAHKVTIQTYTNNRIVERVDVEKMVWQDSLWILKNGYARSFTDSNEVAIPFESISDSTVQFRPNQLIEKKFEPQNLSYSELKNFIAEVIKNGGDPQKWQVDLNFKLSTPFASFILVLFAAPLASHKKRSGAIFGLVISVGIYLLYYGINQFVQTLGQVGFLSPLLSAWTTNVIFFLLGLITLLMGQK